MGGMKRAGWRTAQAVRAHWCSDCAWCTGCTRPHLNPHADLSIPRQGPWRRADLQAARRNECVLGYLSPRPSALLSRQASAFLGAAQSGCAAWSAKPCAAGDAMFQQRLCISCTLIDGAPTASCAAFQTSRLLGVVLDAVNPLRRAISKLPRALHATPSAVAVPYHGGARDPLRAGYISSGGPLTALPLPTNTPTSACRPRLPRSAGFALRCARLKTLRPHSHQTETPATAHPRAWTLCSLLT